MRRLMLLVMLGALAEPALAQTVTSIDTELRKGRCRFLADDGEVGHYALKRCPGLAGARVYTVAGVRKVSLSFRWGKAKAEDVVEDYSLGDKLEWRGTGGKRGFKPHAVIVRVITMDHEKDERHNVLAVIRMEARNACLMATIDEATNTDAIKLARATADAEAPNLKCAGSKAKVVGAESHWAQSVIGFDGDPPPP